jgi:hypothetical protein
MPCHSVTSLSSTLKRVISAAPSSAASAAAPAPPIAPPGPCFLTDRGNERILSLCGTVLNRQPLISCSSCGTVIGTERYLAYIRGRLGKLATKIDPAGQLCDGCARGKGHHRPDTVMVTG